MPGLDGVAVLKRLRQEGIGTPTLFLTAKADVEDRVKGLDAGADDYLAKPFAVPELLARVRAMLRRKDTFSPDLLQAGPLTLNRSTYELCWDGRTQPLSGREFQVMEMLMERPGCVVPCDDLLFHVWGWDSPVEVSVVWVHISNLRKKRKNWAPLPASASSGARAMCWRWGHDLPAAPEIHPDLHPVVFGGIRRPISWHLSGDLFSNHFFPGSAGRHRLGKRRAFPLVPSPRPPGKLPARGAGPGSPFHHPVFHGLFRRTGGKRSLQTWAPLPAPHRRKRPGWEKKP